MVLCHGPATWCVTLRACVYHTGAHSCRLNKWVSRFISGATLSKCHKAPWLHAPNRNVFNKRLNCSRLWQCFSWLAESSIAGVDRQLWNVGRRRCWSCGADRVASCVQVGYGWLNTRRSRHTAKLLFQTLSPCCLKKYTFSLLQWMDETCRVEWGHYTRGGAVA